MKTAKCRCRRRPYDPGQGPCHYDDGMLTKRAGRSGCGGMPETGVRPFLLGLCLFLFAGGASAQELQNIVVRPGDTLWSISNTYLKNPTKWNELLRYNKLPSSDPSIALPGMTLRVPINLIKEEYRAARLIGHTNEVRFRRTGSDDWKAVADKMELFKHDTLHTFVDAKADVRFYNGAVLNLYPNSFAILSPPNTQADVELMAGEMHGLRSKVITRSATITPTTKNTEFGAKIKDDLTTLVQVYAGRASVKAQGKTVEVPAGFASEVKLDMPPSQPIKLPPPPEFEQGGVTPSLVGAGNGPQIKMEGGLISLKTVRTAKAGTLTQQGNADLTANVPKVTIPDGKDIKAADLVKMISVASPVQGYHLQIALDQGFTKLVLDRHYDAFDTINLNKLLPPGGYWMRVSYVDLLGFEGKYNAPRQLMLGKIDSQQ